MRELVHIQVGECGNQIGTKFWESIAAEHGISTTGLHESAEQGSERDEEGEQERESQLAMHHVYFEEADRRYIPRAIMVDFDPSSVDRCRASRYGSLFNPDYLITGKTSTGIFPINFRSPIYIY